MPIQTLNTIKSWFKTTLKPTQDQFWDTWDSFRHKFEKVPLKDVEDLEVTLNKKAEKSQLDAHQTDLNAHSELFAKKEDKANKGVANGYVPLDEVTKIASQYLTIANNLVAGGATSLLSAEQGVVLQNQIDLINNLLKSDNVNLNTIQKIVDAIEEIQLSLNSILVNDLTTGGTTKALTAEMGKVLQSSKEDKSQKGISDGYAPLNNFTKLASQYLDIVNDLVSGGSNSLLSAEQGKTLQDQINGIHTLLQSDNVNLDTLQQIVDAIEEVQMSLSTILVNDLTTGGTTKALTAEMGKRLQDQIHTMNGILFSNDVNLDTIQEIVDALKDVQNYLSTILVNDLTTGGTTKALTAEMGKKLNELKANLESPEFTGIPTAPTAEEDTNSTQIATTEFVKTVVNNIPIPVIQDVSKTQKGLVNNNSLQELGGTDKLINGLRIGRGNSNGNSSAAFGFNALSNAVAGTGSWNTAIGSQTLNAVTTGNQNTAVGYAAGRLITTGLQNTVMGNLSGSKLTTATNTSLFGNAAGRDLTTGEHNTMLGSFSGVFTTTGYENAFLGTSSGNSNTTGYQNTAIGFSSLYNSDTNTGNTMLGYSAGNYIKSNYNVGIGYGALRGVNNQPFVTGEKNIAIGYEAGIGITTGTRNILIENVEGPTIHEIGVTSGSNNTLINARGTTGIMTGSGNTIIGGFTTNTFNANDSELVVLATGTGKVAIRKNTNDELIAPNLTNSLIVSGGSKSLITKEFFDTYTITGTGANNYVPKFTASGVVGNSQIFDNGTNVGIGITNPIYKLDVLGNDNNGIRYTNATGVSTILGSGTNIAQIGALSNHRLDLLVGSVERMSILPNGNVGVGTNSPFTKLDVLGGTFSVSDESTYSAKFSSTTTKGVIIGYDTINNIGHIGSINPTIAWTDLVLNANGGNVGIGKIPSSKFDVSLESDLNIKFLPNTTTTGTASEIASVNDANSSFQDMSLSASNLIFKTNDGAEKLRILSNGNVLVGSTTDDGVNKLQVNGGIKATTIESERSKGISSSDLNDLRYQGMYTGYGLINAPDGGWWYVESQIHQSIDWRKQRLTSLGSENSYPVGTIFERVMTGGSWNSWKQIQFV